MRPSARLQDRIQMLRKVGLSSDAGTTLPACMVAADDRVFEAFEAYRTDWAKTLADNPNLVWADIAWGLKAGLRRKPVLGAAPVGAENL